MKKTSNDNKNVLGANQVFNYIMFSLYSVLMVIQFHYCGIYLKFHYVCSCLPTIILRTWVVFKVYRLVISKISNHQGYNYPGNFSHLLTDSELWGRRETVLLAPCSKSLLRWITICLLKQKDTYKTQNTILLYRENRETKVNNIYKFLLEFSF